MTPHEPDPLRALVRELLEETLAGAGAAPGAPATGTGPRQPPEVVSISIRDDAELNAFAADLLRAVEADPAKREAVLAGAVRFRLTSDAAAPGTGRPVAATSGSPSAPAAPVRVERGALTERAVTAAARDGRSILLGRRAVATPLALDKARALGIDVRREAT